MLQTVCGAGWLRGQDILRDNNQGDRKGKFGVGGGGEVRSISIVPTDVPTTFTADAPPPLAI